MIVNANLQVPIYRPDQFLTNKDFPEIARRQVIFLIFEVITFRTVCTKKPVVFILYNGDLMVESSVAMVFRAPFFIQPLITTIC